MLKINSKPRDIKDDNWIHAIQRGHTMEHLGDTVLCLGAADYVKTGDRIRSINGDGPGKDTRWVVYKTNNYWFISTDIDRIAIEFFFHEVTDTSGNVL